MEILEKLAPIRERFAEVEQEFSDPEVASNPKKLKELGKIHSQLKDVVSVGEELERVSGELGDAKELLDSGDEEMA